MKRSRATVSAHDSDEQSPPEAIGVLYLVLEAHRPLSGSTRYVLDDVEEVVFGRGSEREAQRKKGQLLVSLPDEQVSSTHAKLTRQGADWIASDLKSKNG